MPSLVLILLNSVEMVTLIERVVTILVEVAHEQRGISRLFGFVSVFFVPLCVRWRNASDTWSTLCTKRDSATLEARVRVVFVGWFPIVTSALYFCFDKYGGGEGTNLKVWREVVFRSLHQSWKLLVPIVISRQKGQGFVVYCSGRIL